jgi:hypothetical protein
MTKEARLAQSDKAEEKKGREEEKAKRKRNAARSDILSE